MPKFGFTDTEKDAISAYLKEVDHSGDYPNYYAKFDYTGWVEITYKNEE